MVAIFTYGFPAAETNMKEARVELTTLTHYDAILDEALLIDYIAESEVKTLQDWRRNPETWGTTTKKMNK
jgi:orotate phosphoribosyltransferase